MSRSIYWEKIAISWNGIIFSKFNPFRIVRRPLRGRLWIHHKSQYIIYVFNVYVNLSAKSIWNAASDFFFRAFSQSRIFQGYPLKVKYNFRKINTSLKCLFIGSLSPKRQTSPIQTLCKVHINSESPSMHSGAFKQL